MFDSYNDNARKTFEPAGIHTCTVTRIFYNQAYDNLYCDSGMYRTQERSKMKFTGAVLMCQ